MLTCFNMFLCHFWYVLQGEKYLFQNYSVKGKHIFFCILEHLQGENDERCSLQRETREADQVHASWKQKTTAEKIRRF